jgi:excisionase family DNA binding protein
MRTVSLTTRDVARLLKVSEATVKRWADSGALELEKTVGGHRRFTLDSVAQVRRERGLAGAPARKTLAPRPKAQHRLTPPEDFLQGLLAGDEAGVAAKLIASYVYDQALTSMFDGTITRAMHRLGELWFKGDITVADEHLATQVLLNALQKLRTVVEPTELSGGMAICCAIEGDLHEVPVHLAEILLESQGWEVINLGPNTPLSSLRDMVVHKRVQMICISARSIADLHRATTEYAQLHKAAKRIQARIVIGGEAFLDDAVRQRFPAEFYAQDFSQFEGFLSKLIKNP